MNESIRASSLRAPKAPVPVAARRVPSADLLRGERRVIIEHGEASYTLLLTRNGKLILTK